MLRVLQAFVLHGYLKGLEVRRDLGPTKPNSTHVTISGELNITDFARGVQLELERPGTLAAAPVNPDDLIRGVLPRG